MRVHSDCRTSQIELSQGKEERELENRADEKMGM